MAPASQTPKPSSWSVVAVVFIALFVLLLFGLLLVVGYLFHQRKQRQGQNPYPYGSEDWLDYERATAPQVERDALAIASLETQLSVQAQYNHQADEYIELLERKQKHLTLQLRDEQRKSEPIDPEVFQRVYDDIHKPLEPPRPSLPPLVAKPTPVAQPSSPATSVDQSPSTTQPVSRPSIDSQPAPILLQTTKLQNIMRSNSRSGPANSIRIVEHTVQPSSATPVNPVDFEDVDLSDDEPAPVVGKKPLNYYAREARQQ